MSYADDKLHSKMSKPPQQIPLELPSGTGLARDDLVITGSNKLVVELLDTWPAWPSQVVVLAGPVGSGKTHLAQIWATRAAARFLDCSADGGTAVPEPGNFVVEDIVKGGFDQTWLFHLFNSAKSSGGSLLLTSRYWPGDWGIALPDLQSRMKTAHLVELNEPDDAMLYGVLNKLFSDRQISVDPKVVEYLVTRMERSLDAAQTLVAKIDAQSLSRKKGVSKGLAADVLRSLGLLE